MSPVFSALMRPGMRLMAQLPLWAKMALLTLAALVPVAMLLVSQALAWQGDAAFVHTLDVLVRGGAAHPAGEPFTAQAPRLSEAEALSTLELLLAQRGQAVQQRLLLAVLASLLGMAVLGYLALSFYLSLRESTAGLLGSLEALAAGRLSQCDSTHGRDELAQVGRSVATLGERLSALVSDVRSSAVRVGQAGQQLADDGAALSQRTETQANHLRGSIATLGLLSGGAAAHAEAEVALDALVGTLGQRSGEGSQAMQQTIESITALQESARRVAEINGVIDDIAFQTNLLALNASVEAARAGDSGKGFAVVAAEVRQLAQRCAESAGEIRELIAGTSEQVGVCSQRAHEVDAALQALVGGVAEVSGRLRQLSSASVEQGQGLQSVATEVGNLDDLTRLNAAAVERASATSHNLVTQAQALRQSVAAIHLLQGSADEAHQMVEKAVKRLKDLGWDLACREFNDPDGAFVDRDLALFVVDRSHRYHVVGGNPRCVGRTVHECAKGSVASVDDFLARAWEAAARGAGWIECAMPDVETGTLAARTAYIARLDDETFIGCAVVRPDAHGAAAEAVAA